MAKKQTKKLSTGIKLPPQSLEAEESVLGSILIDKEAINKIIDVLQPSDFYNPINEKIYQAAIEIFNKNQPTDIINITNQLKKNDDFKKIGGSSYLASLAEKVPSAAHIESYAKIVKEKKILRDLIKASAEISETAFNEEKNIEDILDGVEQKIINISQRALPHNLINIKEELMSFYERFEKLSQNNGLRGIPTGFTKLDKMLSGLQKSNFIVIGARPSLGKTSLVLDIARQAAAASDLPVGIFSLEMNREQIIDRLVSAESGVPLWKIRTGMKEENETEAIMLQNSVDRLSRMKIFIDDTPAPTINQIRSMARQLQLKHGLGLLIIDYLQLIQPRLNSDNTVSQFTEVSRGLKSLARELDIPVIAVSQLNRLVDQREVKIPRLSDLRETGAIEQDADIVLFLYRKDKDQIDLSAEDQHIVELIIAKHRNGPIGSVKLYFNPELASFRNLEENYSDDQFA